MKAARITMVLALAVLTQACVIVDDDDAVLTVDNASSYVITELYITPVNATYWGPDLLGADDLYPDEYIDIVDIECGYYDVQIVDEYGYPCELLDEYLCFDSEVWVVTNTTLSICDRFGSV